MKNRIYILIFALLSVSLYTSCVKDGLDYGNDIDKNQLFRPVFRKNSTTGKGDSDPQRCRAVGDYGNDIFLCWYDVEGAQAYHIIGRNYSGSWDTPSDYLLDTIVAPGTFELIAKDFQYSTRFKFAIKALYTKTGFIDDDPAKGEHPYNSEWYGILPFGGDHDVEELIVTTAARPDVPLVIRRGAKDVGEFTETTARIYFDLKASDHPTTNATFQTDGTYYLADSITVVPDDKTLPSFRVALTDQNKADGYVDFIGLTTNANYAVDLVNKNIERKWDKLYNTLTMRMPGDPGEPILIKHVVDTLPAAIQRQACRIDSILKAFMTDTNLAENTTFLLEGGKNYFIQSSLDIYKGFTLKSNDPNNPANVFMGLGSTVNTTSAPGQIEGTGSTFSLGRRAKDGESSSKYEEIDKLIFENINFNAPEMPNVWEVQYGGLLPSGISLYKTGANYFINQDAQGMNTHCEALELRNCSFQRMTRAFIRMQGVSIKLINNITIDNCLFYNTGYYNANGGDYAFLENKDATDKNTNILKNVNITNSSFIGGSYGNFLSNTSNYDWGANVVWNVNLSNNTFLNWMCSYKTRNLFALSYPPRNSTFTIKDNLFVFTKKPEDPRVFFLGGVSITAVPVGFHYDVSGNLSTNTNLTGSGTAAQIFTSNGLNANSTLNALNPGGSAAAKVNADDISPVELMVDPNPLNIAKNNSSPISALTPDSFRYRVEEGGMYYNNTDKVRNSLIFRNNVGDPRWRKRVTP